MAVKPGAFNSERKANLRSDSINNSCLLRPQRDYRINFRRPPRGDVASENGNSAKQQRNAHKRRRIGGRNVEEKSGQESRQRERASQSDRHAADSEQQPAPE